jgi:tetratricopeptide (TPR) repeat protein
MLKIREPRNAYDLLGLPRSATAVQIRARYRQLVRSYRKDRPAKELLEDEQVRRWSNAHLLLLSAGRREYDRRLRESRGREQPGDLVGELTEGGRLLMEAQIAFWQRKLNEAVDLAKEAVKRESRNAEAYALLGDTLREQGKYPNALTMYNYAVQFDPDNRRYWQLLEDATALRDGRAVPKRFRREPTTALNRPASAWVGVGLAAIFVELSILYLSSHWGSPAFFFGIPANLPYWGMGDGLLLGLTLAATGILGPFDDELISYQVMGFGVETTPLGVLVALPGLVFFWAAPGFYAIVAFLDEHISLSVVMALAVCGAVTAGLGAVAPAEGRRAVLLWGGNFVFFGFLCGWLFGSIRARVFEH